MSPDFNQFFILNFSSRPQQLRLKKLPLENEIINGKYPLRPDWIALPSNFNDRDENGSMEANFLDPACVLVEEDEPIETNDDEDEDSPPRSKLRRLLENKV